MTRSVGDGFGAALRQAHKREALEAQGVHYRLQVLHLPFETEVGHFPRRKPVATRVVEDKAVTAGQLLEEVLPDRALPVELQMVQPVGRLDQGGAFAGESIGDARAVRAMAKADVLVGRPARVAAAVRRPLARCALSRRRRTVLLRPCPRRRRRRSIAWLKYSGPGGGVIAICRAESRSASRLLLGPDHQNFPRRSPGSPQDLRRWRHYPCHRAGQGGWSRPFGTVHCCHSKRRREMR